MKKLFTLFLALVGVLTAFSLQAQTTISGTVTDEGDQPLPFVNVSIDGTTQGSTSDLDGKFSFLTDKTGDLLIRASSVGYTDVTQTINANGGNVTVDFKLNSSVSDLDEMIVTATRTRRTQAEAPLSMSYLDSKSIEQLTANSQADILRSIPGITAEGGGGEVASNIFVRGMPAGGQYQFNPLQVDGMPILSTFGLNSSAHDVYFRNDIGIASLEFARGGVSTLYGAGSVAGIINYNSKTGSAVPENKVQLEWADQNRYKVDFLSAGPMGGEGSNLYYAISGFYRYDEGPIKTGLPTEGVQLRGNIKRVGENGTFTVYGQYIDDRAQFYLPLPLQGGNRERAIGNDGEEVMTMQTVNAADLAYATPGGYYQSPIRDGVVTRGGYVMLKTDQYFGDDWKFDGKIRYSKYQHQFNLFLDGSGVGGSAPVETQQEYLDARLPGTWANSVYTYADNGASLSANDRLFENRILDRDRPLTEYVGEFNLSKEVSGDKIKHTITAGTFLSRSEAGDFNVITRYLGDFSNQPRLVNLQVTDTSGATYDYSVNGVTGRGISYNNRFYASSKQAFYLTDEIEAERWRIDVGFRVENTVGDINLEGNQSYTMDANAGPNLQNVTWGNGAWTRGRVSTTDVAIALAGLYKLDERVNLYANASRGYFFPQLRTISFNNGEPQSYESETIIQGEVGAKYQSPKLSGTVAFYNIQLSDRRQVDFVNDPTTGGVIEEVSLVETSTIGVEINAAYRLTDFLDAFGNFTFQRHQYDKFESNTEFEGNWLRRQPQTLGMIGLDFNMKGFDANLSANYIGSKFTSDDNALELDAHTIMRAGAGYTFGLGDAGQTLRLGVSVFNLLDTYAITEGSPRLGNNQTEAEFFVGRPILPRRVFVRALFNF